MRKPIINYILSLFMLISLIIVGISSIIMEESRKTSFLGLNVVYIHHVIGTLFLILLAIHVLLHLKWIWVMTKNIFKKKNAKT